MSPTPVEQHPAFMNLYPVMDSLVDAVRHIESQAPLKTPNEIFANLMLYHNTLLKELCTHECQIIHMPFNRQGVTSGRIPSTSPHEN